jgi:hypothetical protein
MSEINKGSTKNVQIEKIFIGLFNRYPRDGEIDAWSQVIPNVEINIDILISSLIQSDEFHLITNELNGFYKLKNLPIRLTTKKSGSYIITSIKNHAYYVSLLKKDRRIYENYDLLIENNEGRDWDSFLNLLDKIKMEGFNINDPDPPRFTKNVGCINGVHRIAILSYLHGLNAKCVISGGKLHFPAIK